MGCWAGSKGRVEEYRSSEGGAAEDGGLRDAGRQAPGTGRRRHVRSRAQDVRAVPARGTRVYLQPANDDCCCEEKSVCSMSVFC